MSMCFNANQFNSEYEPTKLGNWQVPKWFPEHPIPNEGNYPIVSNYRGHLLPGVPRSNEGPFGSYIPTWSLPRKITREIANKLSAPNPEKVEGYRRRLARAAARPKKPLKIATEIVFQLPAALLPPNLQPPLLPNPNASPNQLEATEQIDEVEIKECSCEGVCKCEEIRERELNKRSQANYIPGDLTNEEHKHPSHAYLKLNLDKENPIKTSDHGYPGCRQDFTRTSTPEKPNEKEQFEQMMKERNSSKSEICKEHKLYKQPINEVKTYLEAASNFKLAKELHKVNLEHFQLPDTITHRQYRKMQMQDLEHDPGLALDDKPTATGVGWKGYAGYGPNKCTKMKVFRPQTSHINKDINTTLDHSKRPSSVESFERKWRFLKQNKVTPMALALCWDLVPNNADDEPKRSTHIDGTNGSTAPAVFSMVTPKVDDDDVERSGRNEPKSGRNVPGIFSTVQEHKSIEKVGDMHDHCINECENNRNSENIRPKTSANVQQICGHKMEELQRAKSAYNLKESKKTNNSQSVLSCINNTNTPKQNKQFHRSSPNVSNESSCKTCKKIASNRLCVACELKNMPTRSMPKHEYKMAFKAGIPNSKSTHSSESSHNSVNIPKQRDPYSKKNYTINSLAPPFCLQKDKREDYPEYWRLASVYQHSYKPIPLRKKTLLQSIYK